MEVDIGFSKTTNGTDELLRTTFDVDDEDRFDKTDDIETLLLLFIEREELDCTEDERALLLFDD